MSRGWTRRLLQWSISVVVVVLGTFAALSYTAKAELPNGLIPPADRYDVRILRDTYGVPHIFGAQDPDVAYGLAYAHAEDDFPTIQGALLAARGRLASAFGKDAAPNDYMVALLRVHEVIEAGYPRLPEDVRELCRAYADGLNHYAALHPEQVIADLYPVQGKDVVAGFVHKLPLFYGIDKVLTGFMEGSVPSAQEEAVKGSNAVALAPSRTEDGSTVLVINSHQPWDGPVAWYEAHLHSQQGWNMAGGVFPGAPIILHGHNQNLGWAHTVNRPDLIDEYVLDIDPENPDRYRFDGRWLELDKRTIGIDVKLWGPFHWTFKREVLGSIHGPVMRTEHGTFALRFSGFGEVRQVEQWYRMNRANSREQWLEAMSLSAIPMFNTVYADARGQIGYVYNARLPYRTEGFDYGLRLPGDARQTVWDHSNALAFEALPQVWDPASGFVQNCNNTPFTTTRGPENPDPAAFSATHGIEHRVTNRGLQAMALFGNDEQLSMDEVLARKFDTSYHPDSELVRLLNRAVGLQPDPRSSDQKLPEQDELFDEAIGILKAFDLETDVEDPHAALAVMSIGPFIEPPTDPSDEQLRQSVLDAASSLKQAFGSLTVPWGDVNRLQRGDVDLPLAGAPDVLHAIYGRAQDDGRLRAIAGDCFVMVARWAPDGVVSSQSLHQYGSATVDDTSPHFADQTGLFANRRLKDVWLDEETIRDHLKREYRPGETSSGTVQASDPGLRGRGGS